MATMAIPQQNATISWEHSWNLFGVQLNGYSRVVIITRETFTNLGNEGRVSFQQCARYFFSFLAKATISSSPHATTLLKLESRDYVRKMIVINHVVALLIWVNAVRFLACRHSSSWMAQVLTASTLLIRWTFNVSFHSQSCMDQASNCWLRTQLCNLARCHPRQWVPINSKVFSQLQ